MRNERFIYVFDVEARDYLISNKFNLISTVKTKDKSKEIFVFENKENIKLDLENIGAVFSNTLTF